MGRRRPALLLAGGRPARGLVPKRQTRGATPGPAGRSRRRCGVAPLQCQTRRTQPARPALRESPIVNPSPPRQSGLMLRWLCGRLPATVLAAVVLLVSTAGLASADYTLLSSTPADGQTVPRTPEAVVLIF